MCSDSLCNKCDSISFLNNSPNNLKICTICSNVITNCNSCTSSQYCTNCLIGYYLSLDFSSCNACVDWNSLCGACSNSYTCTSCSSPINSGLMQLNGATICVTCN